MVSRRYSRYGRYGFPRPLDLQEEEISQLERLQHQRLKGAKRKAAEKRAKLKERLALKMEHPGDRLDIQASYSTLQT